MQIQFPSNSTIAPLEHLVRLYNDITVSTDAVWRYFQQNIQEADKALIPQEVRPPFCGRGDLRFRLYDTYGAHLNSQGEATFRVYAPNAKKVFLKVVNGPALEMNRERNDWVYRGHFEEGTVYNYEIVTERGQRLGKADPYAVEGHMLGGFRASVLRRDQFEWSDQAWMDNRAANPIGPKNVFEVHPMSWKKNANGEYYNYRELAPLLFD